MLDGSRGGEGAGEQEPARADAAERVATLLRAVLVPLSGAVPRNALQDKALCVVDMSTEGR